MIHSGRLEVLLAQKNKSYKEHLRVCEEMDKEPLSLSMYCSRLGNLEVALVTYGKENPSQHP